MFIASVVRNQANLIAITIVIVVLYPFSSRKLHGGMWWLWWMWHGRDYERKKEKKREIHSSLMPILHVTMRATIVSDLSTWLSDFSSHNIVLLPLLTVTLASIQTTGLSLSAHFFQFKHVETKRHIIRSKTRGRRIWHGRFVGWWGSSHVPISAQTSSRTSSSRYLVVPFSGRCTHYCLMLKAGSTAACLSRAATIAIDIVWFRVQRITFGYKYQLLDNICW